MKKRLSGKRYFHAMGQSDASRQLKMRLKREWPHWAAIAYMGSWLCQARWYPDAVMRNLR